MAGMDPAQPMSAPRSAAQAALLSLLLLAAAAAGNAVMDTLANRYERSVFARFSGQREWLDPKVSWRNKWKHGDPKQGEAFFLSSTALVATTDAWHLAKLLTLSSLFLAGIVPFTRLVNLRWMGWGLVFLGLHAFWGLVFEGLFAHGLLR